MKFAKTLVRISFSILSILFVYIICHRIGCIVFDRYGILPYGFNESHLWKISLGVKLFGCTINITEAMFLAYLVTYMYVIPTTAISVSAVYLKKCRKKYGKFLAYLLYAILVPVVYIGLFQFPLTGRYSIFDAIFDLGFVQLCSNGGIEIPEIPAFIAITVITFAMAKRTIPTS